MTASQPPSSMPPMPTQRAPHGLLLLDTASLYFRAFYGVPDTLRAADGTSVNAVRGLLDMIAFLLADRRPSRIVACWDDDWRPAWRVAAISSYKAHRVAVAPAEPPAPEPPDVERPDVEETPAALVPQIPIIVDVLAALGIARVGAPGFEADDVIGTLTAREVARRDLAGSSGAQAVDRAPVDPTSRAADPTTRAGAAVEIVTGDRDLFQLVDDAAGVRVLYPAKGVRALEVVDQAWLRAKYGLETGAAYADMAVLRGDPSDGLPGVAGIGEKTAVALITRYGSLAGVLRTLDLVDPRLTATQRRHLAEARDYLAVAPGVVRVAPDAPIPPVHDVVPLEPVDPDRLAYLAERWNLGRSVTRVIEAMARLAG